jgi:hypothetical protein
VGNARHGGRQLARRSSATQPRKPFAPRGLAERSFREGRIEQQLGDPAALEQVTFLVPNGWTGHDGSESATRMVVGGRGGR